MSIALTELLGAAVLDSSGAVAGRIREVILAPHQDGSHITSFIVRTKQGDRMVLSDSVAGVTATGIRLGTDRADFRAVEGTEGLLLLSRDLLDQQIIDVNGRKVVRVNDVDFAERFSNGNVALKVEGVDVGMRGAVRQLLQGVVPRGALRALLTRIPARQIPWEFVDLIETDPARRVKLKIAHDRLSQLHPADIADILEDLAPAEREAVFEALDEDVAAEVVEEIDPKLQASLVESLEPEHAADIVEEMHPDAAADLLDKLSAETSEEILGEMEPEEREEVAELLEFNQDTAAGKMTTEYIALAPIATVGDAIDMLRSFEGGIENVNTVYLVDFGERLVGAVPLARLVLAPEATPLILLKTDQLISCHAGANEKEVAERFDKYNLLTLPVVDAHGRLTGVITADDVISLLRSKL
ncbi:MAG: CBS domain-containing protein [Acidobacteriota bacterium]|nr:CBS domain-containing protein [Acidobacteriota bacterium]